MRRGLCPSRERAREEIAAGRVLVSGAVADKPARLVAAGEPLHVVGPPPRYVSRGGLKLEAALDGFGIDPGGRRCIDAGASTGGFTDCLLQRDAAVVVAVDVGHGQLHERLRRDPRVKVHERTNVRLLAPDAVGGPASLVVADLSFISLRTVAGALVDLTSPEGDLVTLVKPQFEVGREEASRSRGVITDPSLWRGAVEGAAAAIEEAGAAIMGAMVSPITGADGNVEFLLHARPGVAAPASLDVAALVADAAAARSA